MSTVGTDPARATPARTDSPGKPAGDPGLQKAARQFEQIFVQKMLAAMRKTVPESSLFPKGPEAPMMDHMMDSAVAGHMTQGSGVGIASFLYRKWTGQSLPGGEQRVAAAGLRPTRMAPHTAPVHGPLVPGAPALNEPDLPPGALDDGRRPLREMLPPTGLEHDLTQNDFFLNPGTRRPDALTRVTPNDATGATDGHQDQLNHDPTGSVRDPAGASRQAGQERAGRLRAAASYGRVSQDLGGHQRHQRAGGARQS